MFEFYVRAQVILLTYSPNPSTSSLPSAKVSEQLKSGSNGLGDRI